MFRKPKKNIRAQRRIYNSDDDEENSIIESQNVKNREYDSNGSSSVKNNETLDEDIVNLKEIQSNISKFKESKLDKKKKRSEKATDKTNANNTNPSTKSTLSFEQDLEGGKSYKTENNIKPNRLFPMNDSYSICKRLIPFLC